MFYVVTHSMTEFLTVPQILSLAPWEWNCICIFRKLFCSESGCQVLKGHTYTSSDDYESIKPNPPTNEVCAKECRSRREDNPNINGMIWSEDTKECKCMIGMMGKNQTTGYDICYFGKSNSHIICVSRIYGIKNVGIIHRLGF